MSPNNILNMCMLKELDFIAITDHNSTKQLNVMFELSESYDFVIIPACEVTVKERFDVLCYFRTLKDANDFGIEIENYLQPGISPKKSEQILTDIYDMPVEYYEKNLDFVSLSYIKLYDIVKKYNGVTILAHIERSGSSAINSYRLEDIPFDGVEIQYEHKIDDLKQLYPRLNQSLIFVNSDSHTLMTIKEKEHSVHLQEKTVDAFFALFEGDLDE